MDNLYFEEEQQYGQGIKMLFLSGSVIFTFLTIYMWNRVNPDGTLAGLKDLKNNEFITIPLTLGTILWVKTFQIFLTRYSLRITENAIHYRFSILSISPKKIPRESIQDYRIRKIGIWWKFISQRKKRYHRKHRNVFVVGGDLGLELLLKNGEKILFGTQKPESLKLAMRKFKEITEAHQKN